MIINHHGNFDCYFSFFIGSSDPYAQQRLHQELEWKRQSQPHTSRKPWHEIKSLAATSKDKKLANRLTRELEDVARQFLPQEANEAGAPEAAAFLFETFQVKYNYISNISMASLFLSGKILLNQIL